MPFKGRPLLDLPIAAFKVLDYGTGNCGLVVLCQRSAHATDQAQPLPESHDDAQPQIIRLGPHVTRAEQSKNAESRAHSCAGLMVRCILLRAYLRRRVGMKAI
jgi:hypothetical protein